MLLTSPLSDEDMIQTLERNAFTPEALNQSLRSLLRKWAKNSHDRKYLEELYRLSHNFTRRDVLFISHCASDAVRDNEVRADFLKMTIGSYDFCSALEAAVPRTTGHESRGMGSVIRSVISNVPAGHHSPVHDGDVSALYLLERLGLDYRNNKSGALTDYYRAVERIRLRLDEIKPMLPALMELCVQKQYFKSINEVFSAIDALALYSDEELPTVQSFVRDRGNLDPAAIAVVLRTKVSSLRSGTL